MAFPRPIVYLVGAGPGDPGLLTLRGRECLERADFILYDQLVSQQILDLAPASAEMMCVRDFAPTHAERLPHVHVKLIEEARKGKCVVRLKGGDPLIFGRGGEEADALREAGVPFEIVPGVTAALAAGAYLEIPLTHRSHASAIAFITGHEQPGKPASQLDWDALAHFPGTLVFYMGFARLGAIVAELIRSGMSPQMPATAISHASTGAQRSVNATLGGLENAVRDAGLVTPALVIIGPVAGLRPALSWFEARPLLGMRVLVTRPRRQAAELVHQLELLGALPSVFPVIEIADPLDWIPTDLALDRIKTGDFDWLVFTSANGVEQFLNRLMARHNDVRPLGALKLAAIGPSTASRLRDYHLKADLAPREDSRSETLTSSLRELVRGKRVLLAQAENAREMLFDELSQVAKVEKIVVYRQVENNNTESFAFTALQNGEIDCVTLTSPAIARAFLGRCSSEIIDRMRTDKIHLFTNGPRITAAVREFGLTVSAESIEPSAMSLIEGMVRWKESATHLASR